MRKTIRELLIISLVLGFLYITGLHTEVAAFTQRIILSTGLMNADAEPENSVEPFDFNQDIKSVDGDIINLSEYRGKLIFLNLWASWCGPCRAEMPGIEELYEDLQEEEDIVFIMLSVDRNENAALKFLKRMKFEFPGYTLGGPLTGQLRVPSIPTTFVISPDGQVIKKKVGMARYNTRSFKNFLLENKPK